MARKGAQGRRHGKHKKVDRLTKAERRARLIERWEHWLGQRVSLELAERLAVT